MDHLLPQLRIAKVRAQITWLPRLKQICFTGTTKMNLFEKRVPVIHEPYAASSLPFFLLSHNTVENHAVDAKEAARWVNFMEQGHVGIYLKDATHTTLHRSWVIPGPCDISIWRGGGLFKLAANEFYIHYCETHPSARGRGIFPHALNFLENHFAIEDDCRFFAAVSPSNAPSARAFSKAGYRQQFAVRITRILGLTIEAWRPSGS